MSHIRFKILRSVKPVQNKSGVVAGTRCWKCKSWCDLNVEFLPETAQTDTASYRDELQKISVAQYFVYVVHKAGEEYWLITVNYSLQ